MKKIKKKIKPKAGVDDPGKLKVGMEVLYMTNYTLDRCTVLEVLRKTDLAILSNQIKVSLSINSNGTLNMKSGDGKAVLRVWSEDVENEFNYQLAIRNIPNLTMAITKLSKDLGKSDVINIYNKLKRIEKKYE